ncbi:MAG: hypothetical protein ACE5HE_02205 [Phycisphaerae bacterium]
MNRSVVKRAYDTIALFALLNVAGATAIMCWLVGSGAVNKDKMRRIAEIIGGEEQPADAPVVVEPGPPEGDQQDAPSGGPEEATSQMDVGIMRREAERIKEELRQRLALNNSILLRVTAEREAFENERRIAERQEEQAREYRATEGFAKQVAIYDSLKPSTAVQHLLGLGDPDEAARILLALKTRQAKKIIEAAKRGDQKKMMTIVQRLREVSPGRSEELTSK